MIASASVFRFGSTFKGVKAGKQGCSSGVCKKQLEA
jgi:hypothetical protein